ncbi:hypothetical protein B0A55_04268 [Friedmanniomyces simplex]|uniref:Thiolase-like protein type 1 additional C-terminal domain-containing protein n=1 Tax=Friedmanniomyces simplex TaxID=329884 RepID=A0A4U0X4C0_9PEZI|nr:hypothetical protein B0A55_04268 [Friedmanniomyces simplex]
MSARRHTPIVVGVGDIVNRSRKVEDAVEPLQLMLGAIQKAVRDTGLSPSAATALQTEIDSLDVVQSWTWPYPDLPGLIAERLAINPLRRHQSPHGGNQPGLLFDEAARRISKGESRVALLTGGEALASLSACAAAKSLPPPNWTPLAEEVNTVFSPTTRELQANLGATHSIGSPIQVYPLFENGFRAHRGQSVLDNHAESAQLYAEFAKVAESNEYAWSYGNEAETAQSIGTVSQKNRMICTPYPLLMNAFNTVNLAAACILTSTEHARELGIPEDRWIYALGGAGTRDSNDFWQRPNFWWSPAISRSLDAGIKASGLEKGAIDLFDFYSCFPIVPKLACHHLGMPIINPPKPITLLGGLTSFGGAGNNYSMHALTEMTRQLRKGNGKNGLVLANGGVATYQHVVCLSSDPRRDGLGYPDCNPLPETVTDVQVPAVEEKADGVASIETYTVEYDRNGPLRAHVVGRLQANGHRFLANHADERTLSELCSTETEQIGRKGTVTVDAGGRNLFSLDGEKSRL